MLNADMISIERTLNADHKLLWAIWTEPRFVSRWFGSDPNGVVLSVEIDLRVGGKYKVAFQDSDDTLHVAFGEYLALAPYSKLQCTWEWQSEPGHVSELTVEFLQQQESTRMILKHDKLNPDSLHGYHTGWNATIDKIVQKIIEA